ncbi:MAG: hypothetical protein L0H64_00845 [Pseudonocardia sp.]|nr:hypothetical protein [Pseudonocardia sp.]
MIVPILLAEAIGLSERELIHLINADLFTCGIASIIQSVGFWKVGVRLPLLQGVTFTAVSPMIAIALAAGGGTEGLLVIYGAVIVAGLVTFLLAPYFARLIRFFPPVVRHRGAGPPSRGPGAWATRTSNVRLRSGPRRRHAGRGPRRARRLAACRPPRPARPPGTADRTPTARSSRCSALRHQPHPARSVAGYRRARRRRVTPRASCPRRARCDARGAGDMRARCQLARGPPGRGGRARRSCDHAGGTRQMRVKIGSCGAGATGLSLLHHWP